MILSFKSSNKPFGAGLGVVVGAGVAAAGGEVALRFFTAAGAGAAVADGLTGGAVVAVVVGALTPVLSSTGLFAGVSTRL